MLAKKVVILKKNHEYILKKYGFDGNTYPKKIFVNTETGLNSEKSQGSIGGDLVRRNWILKLALYSIEYDVKQTHMLNLADSGNGMGDFSNIGQVKSIEEGFTHLKSSSKGRLVLQKIHFGKFEYDKDKTQELIRSLPQNATGIVLKRKFEKEAGEEYYAEYIYSAWNYCEKDEFDEEIEYKLNLNFNPLMIDWKGNETNITKHSIINLTSTPIFLIGSNPNYPDNSNNNVYYLNLKVFLFLFVLVSLF